MTDDKPLLLVEVCSHGKKNDGGFTSLQEGSLFSFPACGRRHEATRDKYEIDPLWLAEQRKIEDLRARAAKARAATAAAKKSSAS